MILASLRKQNTFNNLRKDGKFSSALVNSMLNTLRALANIFHNCLMSKLLNNTCSSLGMLMLVNNCDTYANSKAQISMESTKYVPNLCFFFELLKIFCYLKGASITSLYVAFLIIIHMPKYIDKTTTYTFYAMSQHKM